MGHLSIISDDDLRRLRARWLDTNTLEGRLLAAFDQLNRCWKCKSPLLIDEHPSCTECPSYDGSDDPEATVG